MQYYDLGTSGLKVSALSLGCWAFGGDKPSGAALGAGHQKVHAECWGKQENEDTNGAVLAALDSGINLFDNAEVYGDGAAETALGHALQACKDKHPRGSYHIATKVTEAFLAPELIEARLDASLERLQTDYVDLYQIHWPSRAAVRTDRYPDRPLAQEVPLEATLAKLDELRKSGKIRHIGVSNFGDLTRALATGVPIASNQIIYNLLWRGIEDELLPLCKARGVGVLCWSPMAQGLLTGKYASLDEVAEGRARTRLFSNKRKYQRHGEAGHEESAVRTINAVKEYAEATLRATAAETALAWVMSQPGVSTAIMGARNKDQVGMQRMVSQFSGDFVKEHGKEVPYAKSLARASGATESICAYLQDYNFEKPDPMPPRFMGARNSYDLQHTKVDGVVDDIRDIVNVCEQWMDEHEDDLIENAYHPALKSFFCVDSLSACKADQIIDGWSNEYGTEPYVPKYHKEL